MQNRCVGQVSDACTGASREVGDGHQRSVARTAPDAEESDCRAAHRVARRAPEAVRVPSDPDDLAAVDARRLCRREVVEAKDGPQRRARLAIEG
jgi:hypothetical protein